jgi:hypothetical protein
MDQTRFVMLDDVGKFAKDVIFDEVGGKDRGEVVFVNKAFNGVEIPKKRGEHFINNNWYCDGQSLCKIEIGPPYKLFLLKTGGNKRRYGVRNRVFFDRLLLGASAMGKSNERKSGM